MEIKQRDSLIIVVVFLIIGGLLWGSGKYEPDAARTVATAGDLATCLGEKKFVMYGAHWCGYCKKQKKLFGESVTKLNYVECTEAGANCEGKGISGYPTWADATGKLYPGMHSLGALASLSGCKAN